MAREPAEVSLPAGQRGVKAGPGMEVAGHKPAHKLTWNSDGRTRITGADSENMTSCSSLGDTISSLTIGRGQENRGNSILHLCVISLDQDLSTHLKYRLSRSESKGTWRAVSRLPYFTVNLFSNMASVWQCDEGSVWGEPEGAPTWWRSHSSWQGPFRIHLGCPHHLSLDTH